MKNSISQSQIDAVLRHPMVRKVVKYKNGRIWIWCRPEAYDPCGQTRRDLRELFESLPRGVLSGHDDSFSLFNIRSRNGEVFQSDEN